jgi:hypothetical protein
MGCMAVGGALDMLDMFPDDEAALRPARRFADWLMRERHELIDGAKGWSYQHGYNGGREFVQISAGDQVVVLPGQGRWHLDYFARVLPVHSLRTGDPSYFDAWAESHSAHQRELERVERYASGDHSYAQVWQYIPWIQQRLWNATIGEQGLQLDPKHFGPRTPTEATILTPDGEVKARWVNEARWEVVAK